jgi:hypothetical protein
MLIVFTAAGSGALHGCSNANKAADKDQDNAPHVPSVSEVIQDPNKIKEFEVDLNLSLKKSEVSTAVEVESISLPPDKKLSPTEFETIWKTIPPTERQSKSADELTAMIMDIHKAK